jgi:replicative superfamily II helicase
MDRMVEVYGTITKVLWAKLGIVLDEIKKLREEREKLRKEAVEHLPEEMDDLAKRQKIADALKGIDIKIRIAEWAREEIADEWQRAFNRKTRAERHPTPNEEWILLLPKKGTRKQAKAGTPAGEEV